MPEQSRRTFRQRLELSITFRRLDELFEACNALPETDRQSLFDGIRERLDRYMPPPTEPLAPEHNVSAEPGAAINPPNDKIRSNLLAIAQICEAETNATSGLSGDHPAPSTDDLVHLPAGSPVRQVEINAGPSDGKSSSDRPLEVEGLLDQLNAMPG
jgi:hypothetical protein